LAGLASVLVACAQDPRVQRPPVAGGNAMAEADRFAKIEPGSGEPNECTPQVAKDFIGIRIAAPETVIYTPGARDQFTGAFAKVMICGVYQFNDYFLQEYGNPVKNASLVAVDAVSHQVYTGKMTHGHPEVRPPGPPSPRRTADELKDSFEEGWFNENLLDYLPLPEALATYQVYLTLGPEKSNVVTIGLKPRG
jgi:hypothetical protein